MTNQAKRERHRAHNRANRLREAQRKGRLSASDAAWLKAYDDLVLPGRPRKGVEPAPIPPRMKVVPTTALVRVQHLDDFRPPPPASTEPRPEPDARTPSPDGVPPPDETNAQSEPLKGVVICAVCGRPLPCPVHPPGAKPTAPPIDLPDPAKASDEKQKHRGPGFKGRMGGLVAMGARLLKGVGEELRAAGKWYAWDDEMVDEFWRPHAEETTAELATAMQDTMGISDETVSGVITFGGLGAGIMAKHLLDEEQRKKRTETPRAAPPQRPPVVNSTATEAKPEPPPAAAPANGANGAPARERPRVQLEPEMPSVDDH